MSVVVFWVVMPCGLVGGYQRFAENLSPSSEDHTIDVDIHY
jgi:hypothetical protein